jgi:hypothetical protein
MKDKQDEEERKAREEEEAKAKEAGGTKHSLYKIIDY